MMLLNRFLKEMRISGLTGDSARSAFLIPRSFADAICDLKTEIIYLIKIR